MVSKDILVVAVGIVIVAIALIGVFYYQDDHVEVNEEWTVYTIQWREAIQELLRDSGTITEQDTVTLSETLNALNVTEVKVTVSWEDTYPGRLRDFTDEVTMTIAPPGGTSVEYYPGNPSNGTVSPFIITAVLGEKPQSMTINTTDRDTVDGLLAGNTSQNGMGNWVVTLTANIKKPLWVVLKNRGDDYTVTITYKYYWAEVTTTESS